MKANELRIGNYVIGENGIGKIGIIEEDRVEVTYDTFPYTLIDKIKPISLTEQWLIDFGFACNKYGCTKDRIQVKLMNGFAIIYLRNIVNLETDIYTDWMWIAKIRYVHELQNLYFALIGEELTKTSKIRMVI